jgi:hypothetical protein
MPSPSPVGPDLRPPDVDPDERDEFAVDEAFSSLADAERQEFDSQAEQSDERLGNPKPSPDEPIMDDAGRDLGEGLSGPDINDFNDDPVAPLPSELSNRSKGGLPEGQKTDPTGGSQP